MEIIQAVTTQEALRAAVTQTEAVQEVPQVVLIRAAVTQVEAVRETLRVAVIQVVEVIQEEVVAVAAAVAIREEGDNYQLKIKN